MIEVNVLASTLHDQRLGALEAGALLRTVMVEIDVAVFTFDGGRTLRLVNRAGERLLAQPAEQLLGRPAKDLGLAPCLDGIVAAHRRRRVPGRIGPLGGAAHDLPPGRPPASAARARRRQPAAARRRAPGVAAADSRHRPRDQQLARADQIDRRQPRVDARARRRCPTTGATICAAVWRSSLRGPTRSAGSRPPTRASQSCPRRGATASTSPRSSAGSPASKRGSPIRIDGGPDLTIRADPDQLEQLLINVLHNAVDAALQTGGGVGVGWRRDGRSCDALDRR